MGGKSEVGDEREVLAPEHFGGWVAPVDGDPGRAQTAKGEARHGSCHRRFKVRRARG